MLFNFAKVKSEYGKVVFVIEHYPYSHKLINSLWFLIQFIIQQKALKLYTLKKLENLQTIRIFSQLKLVGSKNLKSVLHSHHKHSRLKRFSWTWSCQISNYPKCLHKRSPDLKSNFSKRPKFVFEVRNTVQILICL